MFCVECGKEITNGVKFCPECGASQIVKVEEKPAKAKPKRKTPKKKESKKQKTLSKKPLHLASIKKMNKALNNTIAQSINAKS